MKFVQKLYPAENIEKFATKMLSAVDQCVSDAVLSQFGGTEQKTEREIRSQETSISGPQISDSGTSENDTAKGDFQSVLSVSLAQAQQHISLFFALCTKKPGLLQLVFDNYSRFPKAVKQVVMELLSKLVNKQVWRMPKLWVEFLKCVSQT